MSLLAQTFTPDNFQTFTLVHVMVLLKTIILNPSLSQYSPTIVLLLSNLK